MSIRSELTKTASYLRSARRAILGRGGEISATAGLKDLPDAIYKIPADDSLVYQTDDSVAYRKIVPSGAEEFAQVAKVGGMTYKTRNLIPFPYKMQSASQLGLTATANDDGTIRIVGTATEVGRFNPYFLSKFPCFFSKGTILSVSQTDEVGQNSIFLRVVFFDEENNYQFLQSNLRKTTITLDRDYTSLSLDISYTTTEIGEQVDKTFYPMLNEGSEALPYEPYFEGLRDTKVTELVSEGANLIPFPYNSAKQTIAGVTFTTNSDGSVTINGKNDGTRNAAFFLHPSNTFKLKAGTYTNSCDLTLTVMSNGKYYSFVKGSPHNLGTDIEGGVYIQISANNTNEYKDYVVYPMLSRGEIAIPYKPYRAEAVDTLPISAELRAFLEDKGYGRGVSGYPNYIDFERKVFVQNTYRKVFDGTEEWRQRSASSSVGSNSIRFSIDIYNKAIENNVNAIIPSISTHFTAISANDTYSGKVGFGVWYNATYDYTEVFVFDDKYKTIAEWKSHLAELKASGNPLTIEYALAEPIETDISASHTDDNFIKVEGGGVIRAVNEYEYDAPSTINYIAKVGG